MEKIIIPLTAIRDAIELRKMEIKNFYNNFFIDGENVIFKNFEELKAFSKKLKIPLSTIFKFSEKNDIKNGIKICKFQQSFNQVSFRNGIKYYTYTHLITSEDEPNLMPLHIIVHNTNIDDYILNGGHEAKEVVFVLKGEVRFHWKLSEDIVFEDLKEGDSVYIKPGISHSFVAINKEAELLAFNYL